MRIADHLVIHLLWSEWITRNADVAATEPCTIKEINAAVIPVLTHLNGTSSSAEMQSVRCRLQYRPMDLLHRLEFDWLLVVGYVYRLEINLTSDVDQIRATLPLGSYSAIAVVRLGRDV